MRSLFSFIGILLIIFAIVALGYNGFTYSTREKVAEVGSVQLTVAKEKNVYLSPMSGGIALVAGIVFVILGRIGRRD